MTGGATLRAAADVLTLAGEAAAAVLLAITDAVRPTERSPAPRPGELRLVAEPRPRRTAGRDTRASCP